jgi:hypothetical protein
LVSDTEKKLDKVDETLDSSDSRQKSIEQYANLDHLTREVIDTLIDYITVSKRIPGTRVVPIEIHWNF